MTAAHAQETRRSHGTAVNHIALRARAPRSSPVACAHALCAPALRARTLCSAHAFVTRASLCLARARLGSCSARILGSHSARILGSACARLGSDRHQVSAASVDGKGGDERDDEGGDDAPGMQTTRTRCEMASERHIER